MRIKLSISKKKANSRKRQIYEMSSFYSHETGSHREGLEYKYHEF